jgi:DNA-binding PadR family transcriptional regulator
MKRLSYGVLATMLDGEVDGVEIARRLRLNGTVPSLPTLYRCLRAGMAQGWIDSHGTAEYDGLGRPRQLYALTEGGKKALEGQARELSALANLVLEHNRDKVS